MARWRKEDLPLSRGFPTGSIPPGPWGAILPSVAGSGGAGVSLEVSGYGNQVVLMR